MRTQNGGAAARLAVPVLLLAYGARAFVPAPARSGALVARHPKAAVAAAVAGARSQQHRPAARCPAMVMSAPTSDEVLAAFPYESVLPFLSEHVQPSDQLLILGARNMLPLLLSKDGYGTRQTRSFIHVLDSDAEAVAAMLSAAAADPELAAHVASGQLRIELKEDMAALDDLEQSSVDSVIDNGALDALLSTRGEDAAGACIDAAHRAVRLGNPMICISNMQDKAAYCSPFDARFGWVQELDGDPGAVSTYYRGKINVKDAANDFAQLGIKFYVYTNVDNC